MRVAVVVFVGAFLLISCIIAFNDFLTYKIPNTLLLLLTGLYLLHNILFQDVAALKMPLIFSCGVLITGFVLYIVKVIGAGDAKFLAVATLWMTSYGLLEFILWVSLLGGGLALIYMAMQPWITSVRLYLLTALNKSPYKSFLERILVLDTPHESADPEREQKKGDSRMLPYGVAIFAAELITIFQEALR